MTIAEAWANADKTCFDLALTALGGERDVTAFRGFLPPDRSAWSFTSGGLATGPITRFAGDSPAWCLLSFNARIDFNGLTYESCLEFAGKVLSWLQETTNLKQVGNVLTLRLTDMPNEPIPTPTESGRVLWGISTPLELVFSTDVEYPAS